MCLQLLFQFDQNNAPTILRIHDQRKNNVRETIRSIRRQLTPSPCRLLQRFNSDDSDEEVASTAHPIHDASAVNTNPVTISSTTPVDRPISPVPPTATNYQSKSPSQRPSNQSNHSNSSTHRIRSRHFSFDYTTLDR